MIGVAGEGLTDFKVIKNLLIGIYGDKNLPVTKLRPRDTNPFGWGNLFNYLSSAEFRGAVEYNELTIVQIDTDTCEEWNEGLVRIGNENQVEIFIEQVSNVLINKIGLEFYTQYKNKILFAVAVHNIECWVLPFISNVAAHHSKIVSCVKTVEHLVKPRGFSINQKNYEDGKHYDSLSSDMKSPKTLIKKYNLNPSLKIFVDKVFETLEQNNNAIKQLNANTQELNQGTIEETD